MLYLLQKPLDKSHFFTTKIPFIYDNVKTFLYHGFQMCQLLTHDVGFAGQGF